MQTLSGVGKGTMYIYTDANMSPLAFKVGGWVRFRVDLCLLILCARGHLVAFAALRIAAG